MIILVRIGLLALGVAAFVAAAIFLLRAFQIRSAATAQPYGYGQSAARKNATVEAIKGGFAAFLGIVFLISLAVVGMAGGEEEEPAAVELTETPAATMVETPAGSPTTTPSFTPSPTVDITPTSPLPTLTPSPTPSVTPTPSATPLPTVTVNSPNGLYLRDVPGGSAEVELIPDGAILTLLGETADADGLTWERVRTQQGNEGWVAADFLIYTSGGGGATP